jgi:hypothetical protein
MIFLFNLPRSRNDPSPFFARPTIPPFMSRMLSRTKIRLSLSPIACPTSGLTLATCLRVQRLAIGAAITKIRRNARAASRAARDFRIPKPTPYRTLWSWSPRRQLRRAANSFLRTALLGARLLVTTRYRVMALASIWTSSVGRIAQTGLEWAIIQFRDLTGAKIDTCLWITMNPCDNRLISNLPCGRRTG